MNISFTKQFKQLLEIAKVFKTDFIYVQPACLLGLNFVTGERMDKNNHIMKRCNETFTEIQGLYYVKDLVDIEKDIKVTKSDVILSDFGILSSPNFTTSPYPVPIYLMETISRFTSIAFGCDSGIPNLTCNLMENEQFCKFLNYKAADGGMMLRIDDYLLTLFPGLINVNKDDFVNLQLYDVAGTNQFMAKFIVNKPKKKIIYEVYTRNLKLTKA